MLQIHEINTQTVLLFLFIGSIFVCMIYLNRFLKLKRSLIKIKQLQKKMAHDIRSPLSTLEIAIENLSASSANETKLIRMATQRIKEIANDILSSNQNPFSLNQKSNLQTVTLDQINDIVNELVREKKLEHSDKANLLIKTTLTRSLNNHCVFVRLNTTELQRVLSNLINNAIEAAKDNGLVHIHSTSSQSNCTIKIQDHGVGMGPDVLSRIGKEGFSHNRTNGCGLGLFQAIQSVQSWKGKMRIDSKQNCGTVISIELPIRKHKTERFSILNKVFSNRGQDLISTPRHTW